MNLKQLWRKRRCVGTMIRLSENPAVVWMAKNAQLDFLIYDMEHGAYSVETLSKILLQARALDFPVIVRVPALDRSIICRLLDNGAAGLMLPMVKTPEQVREFVGYTKYPPRGNRGFSSCGAHTNFQRIKGDVARAFEEMDEATVLIAQIEDREAVEHVDQIAQCDGIDVLLIGPNDLSVSYGCPGDASAEPVVSAIRQTRAACLAHGKLFSMHASVDMIRTYDSPAMQFAVTSIDVSILEQGFQRAGRELRGE